MSGPPRPNFTSAPSEPAIRRLGVRSSTHIDQPIRPQVIVPFLVALVLLAIPLYLLRGPSDDKPKNAAKSGPVGFAPSVPAGEKVEKDDKRVELGEVQRIRCSSAAGVVGKSGRLCDELPFFEKALADAIEEAFDCAPRTGDGGTLNYVLTVDFSLNKVHIFPGQSGMWKGPQARRATECVKRAFPAPDWAKVPHNFRYYELAVMAEYRPPAPAEVPMFE